MLANLNSNLILAVFIWVSLTKTPFDLMKNPTLSNWLVRLWAVLSAVGFAYIDGHFSSNLVFGGPRAYFILRDAAEAGVGAVLLYHIGTSDFKGFFDGGAKTDPNTVTGVPVAKLQEVLKHDAQPMTGPSSEDTIRNLKDLLAKDEVLIADLKKANTHAATFEVPMTAGAGEASPIVEEPSEVAVVKTNIRPIGSGSFGDSPKTPISEAVSPTNSEGAEGTTPEPYVKVEPRTP